MSAVLAVVVSDSHDLGFVLDGPSLLGNGVILPGRPKNSLLRIVLLLRGPPTGSACYWYLISCLLDSSRIRCSFLRHSAKPEGVSGKS